MLLLVTLLWGATFVIVKESLNDISSMLFIGFRFSIAGILLFPFLIKIKKQLTKSSVIAGVILGALNFFAFASQTVGLKYTSATKSGFLTGSLVVMVPIFQTIINKKPPTRGAIFGTILVFIGILFLSSGGTSIFNFLGRFGTNFNLGDVLTLICAVLFAIYVVYLDKVAHENNFWVLLSVQIFTTALFALAASFIFAGFSYEPVKIDFTKYLVFGILYTAVFATLITTALQTRFQKEVSPTKAGIIYSFEPIFAAVFALIILNERMTAFGYLGSLLIFFGLVMSEIFDHLFKRNY